VDEQTPEGRAEDAPLDVGAAYRSHGHIVLRRARAMLRNEAEAEDVLQEVFASLAAKPEQFQGRSALSTYLYSATTNACLTRIRNRKTRGRLLDLFVKPRASRTPAPRVEGFAMMQQILDRIPEELAVPAVHYYLDGMTQAEIAKVIGVSRRQVGNLLAKFEEEAKKHREAS
jgi:RNA polymerase sigma-70 factor (ECF subfamily)